MAAKRKLLLADDSMTIQKVVNLTFADENIEVIAVGNGDAALEKFIEDTPDIVLADVNMPGANGYEICETIKQDERTKNIPVILLVGSFEPFSEGRAKEVGADDFLTKPFQSIRLLVNKVTDLLTAKKDEENFLRPLENPNEPVNSFADTLKMEPDDTYDTADESIENLGDTGMDDEMIETAQIGSVPVDEYHKFESAPLYQSFAEDLDQNSLKSPYNAAPTADYPPSEDWAKTQPLSKADLDEIRNNQSEADTAPLVDLDELELLDFPRATPEENPGEIIQDDFAAEAETPVEEANETTENSNSTDEKLKTLPTAENVSPELVDAIADRVVEKLSGQFIERVVRETITQMEKEK